MNSFPRRPTRHSITAEMYAPASFCAPEGGPEVRIFFDFYRPRPAVLSGPLTSPPQDASISFVGAWYTHDNSVCDPQASQWAEEWLLDHEDKAIERAYDDIMADDDRMLEADIDRHRTALTEAGA